MSKGVVGDKNPAKRPEVRKKISEALKGRKFSEERKKALSIAQKGKRLSEEHKRNISKGKLGCIPWNKGVKNCFSEETLERMSNSHKGQKKPELTIRMNKLWVERKKNGWIDPKKGETYEQILGIDGANKKKKELSISLSGRVYSYETIKKMSEAHRGMTWEMRFGEERANELKEEMSQRLLFDGNPNWRGGTGHVPYDFVFNKATKDYVRERDSYICQICKTKENGNAHDIHHIDYDKQNSVGINLLCLCHSCHSKVDFNRETWQEVLEEYQQNRLGIVENE